MIAPEHGDSPDDVIALVRTTAEPLQRLAHTPEKPGLLRDVPDDDGVADPAEFETQHADDPRRRGFLHVLASSQIPELLRGREEQPDSKPSWWRSPEPSEEM